MSKNKEKSLDVDKILQYLEDGDISELDELLDEDEGYAVEGSGDKRIIVCDTKLGVGLSSLQHLPILGLAMSTDVTRIAVHLFENRYLPIMCLHNTPATYVKAPVCVAPPKGN